MTAPEFRFDPLTLKEVVDDQEAATAYANDLLAAYRALGTDSGEQKVIAPKLIQWLRISGQLTRAEEVARSAVNKVCGPDLLNSFSADSAPNEGTETILKLGQINPVLRLATALQWNSEPGEDKYGLACALFDLCVDSANELAFGTPPVAEGAVLLLAVSLQHRGKQRLSAQDLYGALRDINLGLTYRLQFHAPDDQIESSWEGVNSLINQIEALIQDRDRSIGASIETETFAAGDRSGYGAVSNGHRVGPWLFWLKNGRLKAFGDYHEDQLDGPWYWFREQGSLLQEGSFKANRQSGPWVRYYANGNRLDQGSFENGEKIGPWTYFDEDGKVKRTTVHKIKKDKR